MIVDQNQRSDQSCNQCDRITPELKERYARARELRRENRFEEIHDIARSATPENAHAKRVLIDAIKWSLGKEDPDRFGDHSRGVTINNQTNVVMVSEERQRALQTTRQRLLSGEK